jgi:hypothetical protein
LHLQRESLINFTVFKEELHRYSSTTESIVSDRETYAELRSITMKRIISALIASVALFAAVSSVADAATAPAKCNGPASYCNVFFGQ